MNQEFGDMTNYLSECSSEYCVCGHSAKDHEIIDIEGVARPITFEQVGDELT
jgi:hypothetical protein